MNGSWCYDTVLVELRLDSPSNQTSLLDISYVSENQEICSNTEELRKIKVCFFISLEQKADKSPAESFGYLKVFDIWYVLRTMNKSTDGGCLS